MSESHHFNKSCPLGARIAADQNSLSIGRGDVLKGPCVPTAMNGASPVYFRPPQALGYQSDGEFNPRRYMRGTIYPKNSLLIELYEVSYCFAGCRDNIPEFTVWL
jgi:hypothetical protein